MGTGCGVETCEKPQHKKGYCTTHYSRWYRHGDPERVTRALSNPGKDAAFRRQYVIDHKLASGCVDCGYRAHHAALDFDHLPGTTKVRDIKSGQQLGWDALLAEIAKCEVVCANCHRIRTVSRRSEEVIP